MKATWSYAMGIITAFLLFYLCCVPMVMVSCMMDFVGGSMSCIMDFAGGSMSHMMDFVVDCLHLALVVGLCSHLHHAATLLPPANGPPIPVHSSTHAPLVQYCLDSLLGFKEGLREDDTAHS